MFTCKDCQRRHLHCHSECEEYQKARNELDERNEKIRKAKEEESIYATYIVECKRKNIKRKHKP